MAKVVFLDIDGVCHQVDDPRGPFRPKCMMQLKKLVHGSGAEICLSSSWRESEWGREKVDKYLTAHDMPRIASTHITAMPEEGYNTRGDEILAWLHAHPEVTHWVVLDDLDLTWDDDSVDTPEVLQAHFVQTDPDLGMTADDFKQAMQILEEPCKMELPPSRRRGEVLDTPGTTDMVMEPVMEDGSVPSTPEGVAARLVVGELFDEVVKLSPLIDSMAATSMSPSTGQTGTTSRRFSSAPM